MVESSKDKAFYDRLSSLERQVSVLRANMDMLKPREIIAFQAGTVEVLKAMKEAFDEGRKATNRRIGWSISISALVLATIQLAIAFSNMGMI